MHTSQVTMADSRCPDFDRAFGFRRRELLRLGGLSLFGLSLSDLLGRTSLGDEDSRKGFGRAKSCIFLFMWGGPAHQDTLDLKPDAPVEIRGEFRPISTKVPGIQICEHLPRLAQRTDRCCIVRSLTHTDVNHTSATHYLLTGQPPPPTTEIRMQWPHLGSVLGRVGRGSGPLPPFVSMRPKLDNDVPRFVEQSQGQFAGWLGPRYDPFTIDHAPDRQDYKVGDLELRAELSVGRLNDRRRLLEDLNRQVRTALPALEARSANQQRAFDLLTSSALGRGAFDLDQEPRSLREAYGMNAHGQSVLQARRLVERGVPLVTVFWPNDGIKNVSVYWDTHSRNFVDLKDRLMPVADQAFSTLLDDLQQRGMLEETLVVWCGEFGRTPRVGQRNSDAGAGRDGRDHWPGCFSAILAGGGARRGFVYGRSDNQAAFPADHPVSPAQLAATLYHLLGVSSGLELRDANGRPHLVRPTPAVDELCG